jgi:hypothetical protein
MTVLAGLPGGQRIAAPIAPDVREIISRYKVKVTAGYAATGHAAGGEHPLGLAIDVVPDPGRGGTWDDVDRLARDVGWQRGCGPTGCVGQLDSNFRFVGYDGYPNHGRGNHLHISWAHGAGGSGVKAWTPGGAGDPLGAGSGGGGGSSGGGGVLDVVTDPIGSFFNAIFGAFAQEGVRVLLYVTLVIGGIGLAVLGTHRAARAQPQRATP